MLQKKFNIYLSGLLACTFFTQNIELSAQTTLHFNITNDDNEGVAFAIIEVPEAEGYATTDFKGDAILELDDYILSDSIKVIVSHVFHETRTRHISRANMNEKHIHLSLKKKVVNVSEAVVTGRLNAIRQDSTIRAVRVLDRSIIEGRSATTGRDLFRNELNIKTSEDAILGSGISMGGLGGENIKILIDGVPVIGRLNGGIDLSQIDLSNIEQVEIIEGPMSVEYGTDALAGTINFISKYKSYDSFNVSIGNKYESTGQHTQTLNNYMQNSSGKIAINASRLYFDGWSPGDKRIDWINDYYADSGRVNLWKPKLQYTFGVKGWYTLNNWTIKPSIGMFNEKLINKGYPRAPYGEVAFDEHYLTRRYNSSITLNHFNSNLKDLEVLFSLNTFRRYKHRYSSDLTTLNSNLISANGESDTTSLYEIKTRGNHLMKQTEKLALNIGWDVSHEALSGARISQEVSPITDVAPFFIAKIKNHNNSIQLGLRKAWNSSFRSPLTPSIHGLLMHEKNTFRFSYAKGFRSPSLKEMHLEFVDSNHNLLGNVNLTPETSHNIQAGLTRTMNNHAITVQTSWNYLDNMIMLIQTSDELSYTYENIGTFESIGIKTNYSSTWGKLNWDVGGRWNAIKTNDLKMYTTEIALDLRWNFNNSRTQAHVSTKYNGKENRFFLNNEDVIEIGETAAYTFTDITLSHKNKKGNIRYSIGARNLFDIQNISTTGVGNSSNSQAHLSSDGLNLMSWGRSIVIDIVWNLNKK